MTAIDPLKSGFPSPEPKTYEPSMEEILASIRRIIADDQSLPGRAVQREDEANLRAALDSAKPRLEPEAALVPSDRPAFLRSTNSDGAAVLYRHPAAHQAPQPVEHAPQPVQSHVSVQSDVSVPLQSLQSQPADPRHEPSLRPLSASSHQGHIAAPQFAMPDPGPRAAASLEVPPSPYVPPQASGPAAAPEKPGSLPGTTPLDASLLSDATRDAVAEAFNRLALSRLAGNSEAFKEMVREMLHPLLKSWLDDNLPALIDRLVRDEIERAARGGR